MGCRCRPGMRRNMRRAADEKHQDRPHTERGHGNAVRIGKYCTRQQYAVHQRHNRQYRDHHTHLPRNQGILARGRTQHDRRQRFVERHVDSPAQGLERSQGRRTFVDGHHGAPEQGHAQRQGRRGLCHGTEHDRRLRHGQRRRTLPPGPQGRRHSRLLRHNAGVPGGAEPAARGHVGLQLVQG